MNEAEIQRLDFERFIRCEKQIIEAVVDFLLHREAAFTFTMKVKAETTIRLHYYKVGRREGGTGRQQSNNQPTF